MRRCLKSLVHRCGNAPNWKQPRCPSTQERINNRARPHSGNYSSWRQDGLEVCVTLGRLSKQSWDKRGQTRKAQHTLHGSIYRNSSKCTPSLRAEHTTVVVWNRAGVEQDRQEVFCGADHYLGRCALMSVSSCFHFRPAVRCAVGRLFWAEGSRQHRTNAILGTD